MENRRKDKEIIKRLESNKNTKKLFKRQPKLEKQKTASIIQTTKAFNYIWAYLLSIIFVVIAILLYKYYMIPYWEKFNQKYEGTNINSIQEGWDRFINFFQMKKDLGAVFDIVFIILSIISISYLITGCIYWLLRCIGNIKTFGRDWYFWLILAFFSWIPILNLVVIMIALKKYKWYQKIAIANQTELSTANVMSEINQNQLAISQ